ncbi:16S rRNA (cytidine(1402)-2'-O)-methyltransferase [Mycoplasmopsis caviae]|uniref:Ribosomal RNA small subunit methyltransferase I n=1 Tax=Mycoplasmopsis caviae TaxID=55603 RepID=A0A3P8MEJ2_9BACT|nr:16S rRNA (cytidine(1402)-2'-O)-methyltransferase [Mycoplasmopsis caviae]UUD35397.1 16S rRNA (cytidine(1402)-2'-O)-methyltransferase [Mycoplasmopsis caviae]VDR41826.1 Ribosomal RNA small subunit methyltransferase I [Mycoplasmopsis caviae]
MPKIYIVGTPIGNLKDITLRALETLKNVDIIACEDTRTSSKLLNHYEINKRLISYNKINEKASANGLINLIKKDNLNIALISDAGMPLVSDPGFELIKQARLNKIDVEIVPGVNAAISAFALSGLSNTFVFMAFPKEKSGQRLEQVKSFSAEHSYVFYVAPHKLENFLIDIHNVWSDQAQIFMAREITKLHEEFIYATASELLERNKSNPFKGEITLVIKLKEHKKEKINKYAYLK